MQLAQLGISLSFPDRIANFNPSVESLAVYALMPNGLTLDEQIAMNDAINGYVALGVWSNTGIGIFQCDSLEDPVNALIDWRGNQNAVLSGTPPTHTPGRGFRTNGTSSFINRFNPAADGGIFYTQNDGFVNLFLKKNNSPAATGTIMGSFQSATQRVNLSQVPTTNPYFYRANNATGRTYTSDSVLGTHTHIHGGSSITISRSNSTTVRLNINGRQVDSSTQTSTTPSTADFYTGCLNTAGVAGGFMDIETGCFMVGSFATVGGVAQKVADIRARLMLKLEGGYPDWARINISLDGQSNAEGFTVDTPSTSPVDLTAPITGVSMRTAAHTFATLDYPTNNAGDNYGAELTLGYDLQAFYGGTIGMSKTAESGAPLAVEAGRNDFSPLNSELFPIVVDGLNDLHELSHQAELYPINIVVWIQGERDTNTDAMANAYGTNLTGFFDAIATNSAPVSYIVMNALNQGITAAGVNATRLATVRQAQIDFVSATTYARLLDMNQFTLAADNLHFSGPTYENMGYVISSIIKTITA